jgi:hypothetical protein
MTRPEPTEVPRLERISPELVDALIDFAPTERARKSGFAAHQREGTAGVFNMLATNRCAYLADEVGMGKTYVALGVMGVLRALHPEARIAVIAPRENIQHKWVKEQSNFVRRNWLSADNRVRSLHDTPAWPPTVCRSLPDFIHELCLAADRDFFLRMPSFSLALSDTDRRKALRRQVRKLLPWIPRPALGSKTRDGFRDQLGRVLNAAVPDIDLLVVDEAHNLKHGFSAGGSTRNRMLGLVFGNPAAASDDAPWYRPRVKRLLLLSATPIEDDYAALWRQLDVFGFGQVALRDSRGGDPRSAAELATDELTDADKKRLAGRLLVRRVSGLQIAGELHTRNMYRREWRKGGLEEHGVELAVTDPRQRLIVALVQKKVAEILDDERFGNRFQIGMLSSFESFVESVGKRIGRARAPGPGEQDDGEERTFDGDQEATTEERAGIDTAAIGALSRSYGERFGERLPHPKLDATCAALMKAFEAGEKSLVFVRRVATVGEMAARLETMFDRWLKAKMIAALPGLEDDIHELFARYERERRRRPDDGWVDESAEDGDLDELGRLASDDDGGAESFFAWFFRGLGPKGVLSGAAFQKNRLSSTSSVYSTLFEDDYVSRLLGWPGWPPDVVAALAARAQLPVDEVRDRLRRRAHAYFAHTSKQREGYPRLVVYDGYQVAGLELLAATGAAVGERAELILQERYERPADSTAEVPPGFPNPETSLGARTFIVSLEAHPELRDALWPSEETGSGRETFRRREQRRELLSAMFRLGAAFVDLYLLAIAQLGSFRVGTEASTRHGGSDPMAALATALVERLEQQRGQPGVSAYNELHQAAEAFETLLAVNFETVPGARLKELPGIYGATLQRQVPVGRMSGGVNKRLVRQFRMPGFPLVLITTDVLQEGEDLHTFCRQVVHYGITWTPSAIEQRTGRVDRIGSLTQRRHDGRPEPPEPEELLQVFYPYLRDTVEVLQVQEVFRRLNRFIELIHKGVRSTGPDDSRIDASRGLLEGLADIEPIRERLESAFPIEAGWTRGEVATSAARPVDLEGLEAHLQRIWDEIVSDYAVTPSGAPPRRREGRARVGGARSLVGAVGGDGVSELPFELELRSQASGGAALLRCKSYEVARINPGDPAEVDELYDLAQALGAVRLCLRLDERRRVGSVTVQEEIMFDPGHTQPNEVIAAVRRTLGAAYAVARGVAPEGETRLQAAPEPEALAAAIDAAIAERDLRWTRRGAEIDVELYSGRHQRVMLGTYDDLYTFRSVAARASLVTANDRRWRELALLAWRKNALSELVGFGFDDDHNLIGIIEQPRATLDPEELVTYVQAVARECDRLEYALTGQDVE